MTLEEPALPTPRRSGIRFDFSYLVSLPGLLKIAQTISNILCLICTTKFTGGDETESDVESGNSIDQRISRAIIGAIRGSFSGGIFKTFCNIAASMISEKAIESLGKTVGKAVTRVIHLDLGDSETSTSNFSYHDCEGCHTWFVTISIIAFCLTGVMLLGRTIHIDEKCDSFPWLKLELLIGIISTLSYMTVFGRVIAVVPKDLQDTLLLHGITIFSFLAIIFYGWDTVRIYRQWRRLSSRPRR